MRTCDLLGIKIINTKSVAVEIVGGKDIVATFLYEDRTTTTLFMLSGGS